jgi:hypothetical protein
MLSLKQYLQLDEGNELQQRVNKHLAKGHSIGTVSPEGPHTDTPEKTKAAHAKLRSDLEASRKSGKISGWSGPHKGQYQYGSGSHQVSHEGAYVVHHHDHKEMVSHLKKLGNEHNQETTMHVKPSGEAHYSHLNRSSQKGREEPKGKIHYNVPLVQDEGNTKMKRGKTSFTVHNKPPPEPSKD